VRERGQTPAHVAATSVRLLGPAEEVAEEVRAAEKGAGSFLRSAPPRPVPLIPLIPSPPPPPELLREGAKADANAWSLTATAWARSAAQSRGSEGADATRGIAARGHHRVEGAPLTGDGGGGEGEAAATTDPATADVAVVAKDESPSMRPRLPT